MIGRLRVLLGRPSPHLAQSRRVVPLADYDIALRTELMTLPRRTQAAFAAATAQRLYPAYESFVSASRRDDHGVVHGVLLMAWDGAKNGAVALDDPGSMFETCVGLIPGDESDDGALPAHAEDAISAVAYAFQAAAGLDVRAAGFAAQAVTNTIDNFVQDAGVDINGPDGELQVWEHPLVRAEIERRNEDLLELTRGSAEQDSGHAWDWYAAVDSVRARATSASALPIGELDNDA